MKCELSGERGRREGAEGGEREGGREGGEGGREGGRDTCDMTEEIPSIISDRLDPAVTSESKMAVS